MNAQTAHLLNSAIAISALSLVFVLTGCGDKPTNQSTSAATMQEQNIQSQEQNIQTTKDTIQVSTAEVNTPPITADNPEQIHNLTMNELGNQVQASVNKAGLVEQKTGGQTQACMLSGSMVVMGQSIKVRDCMQASKSVNPDKFKKHCEDLVSMGNAMASESTSEITYIDNCPLPAQAVCRNMMGSSYDGFYYERTPEDLTSTLPTSCQMLGGTYSAS